MVSLVYKRKDEKKMCCFWKYDHPHQNPFGWCFHGGEHQDTSLIFSKWHPGSWELKPWPKWYLGSGLETPAESGPSQTFFTCCGMLLAALDERRDHREIVSEKWTPLWRHLCRHHRADMGATRDGGNLGELVESKIVASSQSKIVASSQVALTSTVLEGLRVRAQVLHGSILVDAFHVWI